MKNNEAPKDQNLNRFIYGYFWDSASGLLNFISSEPPSVFASVSKNVLTLSDVLTTKWLPDSSPNLAKPSYPMMYETMSERICSSCFERCLCNDPSLLCSGIYTHVSCTSAPLLQNILQDQSTQSIIHQPRVHLLPAFCTTILLPTIYPLLSFRYSLLPPSSPSTCPRKLDTLP